MLSSTTPEAPAAAAPAPAQFRSEAVPAASFPADAADAVAGVVGHLARARAALEGHATAFPRLAPAVRALARLQRRLERPLRIGIVGEFNSGKSSLANLLAGIDSLPTAIVSNTRIPTRLYQSAAPEIFAVTTTGRRLRLAAEALQPAADAARLEVGLPAPRLSSIEVVDLPGLADPRFEDASVDVAAQGVDMVLWCTVATQAWKESERAAWAALVPRLRERGILVVTHRDLLDDDEQRSKVMRRLRNVAAPEFRDIVMLSTAAGAEPPMIALPLGEPEKARAAGDLATLELAVTHLAASIRKARAATAYRVMNRIAAHAMTRIAP